MFGFLRLRLLASVIVLASMGVSSHPHSWVDVESYVDGEQQQVKGISMLWRFDPMTSAYMLDGEDLSQAQREQTLQRMAQDLVNNIRDFNYFTEVYWNQERQVLAGASVPRVEVKGLNVSFSFYLSFEHPLSLEHTIPVIIEDA